MGGISAMNSVARVLAHHGDELVEEFGKPLKEALAGVTPPIPFGVVIENHTFALTIFYKINGVFIDGPALDIDLLAERYGECCEVGY